MAISPRFAIRTFSNTAGQYCGSGRPRAYPQDCGGLRMCARHRRAMLAPVRWTFRGGVCGMAACLGALLVFAATASAAPPIPTITEPASDGQVVNPADVHMEVAAPEDPGDDACTDWEIRTADLSTVVWRSPCQTDTLAVHIHLGDGT